MHVSEVISLLAVTDLTNQYSTALDVPGLLNSLNIQALKQPGGGVRDVGGQS